MELDPERMRLKRIEEQLQAERRKFEEERRRFDEERRASQPLAPAVHGAAPTPAPAPDPVAHLPLVPQAPIVPLAPPAAAGMGNKTAMFLGGAGAVLLLGIGLLLAKSLWFSAPEEGTGAIAAAADASAAPAAAVVTPTPAASEAQAPPPPAAPDAVATQPVDRATVAVVTADPAPAGPNELPTAASPAVDEAAALAAKKAEEAARRAEALAKKRAAERAAARKQAELDKEEARRLVVQAQSTASKSAKVDYLRRAVGKDPANVLYPQLLRQAEAELAAEQQAQARKLAAEAAARKQQAERPQPAPASNAAEAARLADLGKRATSKAVKVMYLKQAVAKDPLNAVYRLWLKQAEQELAAENAGRPAPQAASPAPQPAPGRVATSDSQAAANYASAAQRTPSKTLKVFYWRLASQKDPGNAYYKAQLKQAEADLAAESAGGPR
ncbi:MAG: hypothetical protein FJ100_16535 [Deltaproteobacteria bacterium]|nr:hypothetical protein [Deltaproteobacteria bacterium]